MYEALAGYGSPKQGVASDKYISIVTGVKVVCWDDAL